MILKVDMGTWLGN